MADGLDTHRQVLARRVLDLADRVNLARESFGPGDVITKDLEARLERANGQFTAFEKSLRTKAIGPKE